MTREVRRLLVLDTSYSLEAILARGLQESVTCRDLNGYFDHVWTVHPVATLVTSDAWSGRFGGPEEYKLAPGHTFIEGKFGRYRWLRWAAPLNFLIAQICIIYRLSRLIRRERISVVRVGDPHYLGILGWILARLNNVPLVVRIGGNYDKVFESTGKPNQGRLFKSRKIEKKVEKFVLSSADLVACVNQDNLNFALANGARPQFSTIFRYGNLLDKRHFVDPNDRADGREKLNEIGVGAFRFLLCIGRLESVKHSADVVRVVADVRRRGNDVAAVFVGDGGLRESLYSLACALEVQDYVVFCGNRDQGWLASVIPLAAVVLSPITGRALSEVALAAAPIVAYDIDWQGELIESGKTGELVPHLAWSDMAEAVVRLLNDRDYARSLGQAVRHRALKMLDSESLDQHERDQYSELLNRTKNPHKDRQWRWSRSRDAGQRADKSRTPIE